MSDFSIRRNYMTGWYTLSRDDAINGLVSSLLERKGVKKIRIPFCTPAQLEGDKGYEMQVSYEENLDETFGFPKDLDKIIFLDCDSYLLPYNVEKIALETQAGIVITTPSLKDEYYDVGNIFPRKLVELMENANKNGTQIVGITPSMSWMKGYCNSSSKILEKSIISYLNEHPSIKNFIIVCQEEMKELSAHLIKGDDIPWGDEGKAKDILNGKVLIKERKQSRPYEW